MAPTGTLSATRIVDADHPTVVAFARRHAGDAPDPIARAVALYYAVRDGIRHDAYQIALTAEGLCASGVLARGRGWCVSKAVLLAACCRALGIPARLGSADVRNHLTTASMRAQMGTDVLYWHGYTDILLDGHWRKATPAVTIELCVRFGLKPLEFDGRADSIYHPFDEDGRARMEYLRYRGEYADVPSERIRNDFALHYPQLGELQAGDCEREVALETGR